MSPISTDSVYNMKVVAQETGIKPDTLRAWERRYDLPQPDRTSGGHRLYSQRDIETIKWLMARQDEGLTISRAVELWRSLKDEGKDPLQAMAYQETETPAILTELPSGDTVVELREAWISACLDFDEPQAERVLTQAFARYPPETVCIELLQKGLSRIGDLWHAGQATVQQEHFASALTLRRLDVLVEAAPAPTRPERVLIGCPPGEEHIFSPLLVTLMLRRSGRDVLYLGANVPLDRFETTVKALSPHLVILPAQQLHTAATLLDVAKLLQADGVPLGFGGLIFNRTPAVRQRIPGHFLGERLDRVIQAVERLLTLRPPTPDVESPSETYQQALAQFSDGRVDLEGRVWQVIKTNGISSEHLAIANRHLAQDILAAMKLGDMDLLGPEITWVRNLMENHDLEPALLYRYLQTYQEVAEEVLGESGRPVIDWLARVNGHRLEDASSDSAR